MSVNDTYDAYELCLIRLYENSSRWKPETNDGHMMRALFRTLIAELLRQERNRIDALFGRTNP